MVQLWAESLERCQLCKRELAQLAPDATAPDTPEVEMSFLGDDSNLNCSNVGQRNSLTVRQCYLPRDVQE